VQEGNEEKLDCEAKHASITQILQTPQLTLHLISPPKGDSFHVFQQLFVRIGIPLSFKNIAECRARGAHGLESLYWAYKLPFMRIAGPFEKAAEGNMRPIEVVENARYLGSDLMSTVVNGSLHVKYPMIYPFKAVSYDIDLLQLGDQSFVVTKDSYYFFCQVFCLA